jgi:hypothetical protein
VRPDSCLDAPLFVSKAAPCSMALLAENRLSNGLFFGTIAQSASDLKIKAPQLVFI